MTQPPQITGKGGRPKRRFTVEEEQLIEQYARNNCYDRTISTALNIPIMTLKRRFGTKIRRWRAQGKIELRENQRKLSKTSATMAQFLGKNELDQTDKQVIEHEETQQQKQLTEAQQAKVDRFLKFEREQSIRPHKGTG